MISVGIAISVLTLIIMVDPTRDYIYQTKRQIAVEWELEYSHKIQRVGNKVWNSEGYFIRLKLYYHYKITKPHALTEATELMSNIVYKQRIQLLEVST